MGSQLLFVQLIDLCCENQVREIEIKSDGISDAAAGGALRSTLHVSEDSITNWGYVEKWSYFLIGHGYFDFVIYIEDIVLIFLILEYFI